MYISLCFVKRIGIYIALYFLQSFCVSSNPLCYHSKIIIDMLFCQVVADEFVDGHLHKFTHYSNENVHLYKQAYDEVCVVANNMFVDDHFQKLSKISDETGNVRNNSCKIFGALVGCPDKSMKHEINKPPNFRRINQRVKALKNWKWDEVIEIDSFGEDS
ncbi:hypothetical protein HanRHA438_Chr14g0655211 [Helianthus annuus]|uniref:Uncharacterized protein n=1 Tax=Helianthus annuus TaxID=4232 RepID=A0A9K3H6R5_HELAN|nr:hypothetical protein HanXRQr2_Chr14g0644541 [Helianthus annuus]KAJ0485784.1 hypothetical protein HanHA89_Chr14g0572261 [Helianthus annuus]KAJ0656336.1 hypothetical protein HanLR1_Chr14g0534651 [Helianthus annuus]KAJ0853785.1 hypothetical protein HanRHA438_Chr14g0655211 [Helianthus annuus]